MYRSYGQNTTGPFFLDTVYNELVLCRQVLVLTFSDAERKLLWQKILVLPDDR